MKNWRSDLEIVSMAPEHLDRVMEIEASSFDAPWSRTLFLQEIYGDGAHFFVPLLKGRTVGYGGFWLICDEAHITNIAIDPDFRGKGLGRHLLNFLHSHAVSLGAERATLEVRTGNHVAQRLYESVGYIPIAIRKNYYIETGEDAILMWKTDLPKDVTGVIYQSSGKV